VGLTGVPSFVSTKCVIVRKLEALKKGQLWMSAGALQASVNGNQATPDPQARICQLDKGSKNKLVFMILLTIDFTLQNSGAASSNVVKKANSNSRGSSGHRAALLMGLALYVQYQGQKEGVASSYRLREQPSQYPCRGLRRPDGLAGLQDILPLHHHR